MNTVTSLKTVKSKVASLVEAALAESGGLLRLAPCWVPRSFLQPGKRLKLHPDDLYAFGLNRGGIDERWFASTTPAANENRTPDEGLSYVVAGRQRFTLQQAVAECGATLIGERIWSKYKKWPVYSKFFDNMGPIPHHMHQNAKQAALLGLEGKPESYYFPPQHNNVGNNFPYTFMGLEPGTTKARRPPLPGELEQGRQRHPRSQPRLSPQARHRLAHSAVHSARARLALHLRAAMGQRRFRHVSIAGRRPRSALVAAGQGRAQEIPSRPGLSRRPTGLEGQHRRAFQGQPLPGTDSRRPTRASEGYMDRWIVYGKVDGEQLFTAKELTVEPRREMHASRTTAPTA